MHGGPRGVEVSYTRGTPVALHQPGARTIVRATSWVRGANMLTLVRGANMLTLEGGAVAWRGSGDEEETEGVQVVHVKG